MKKQKPSAQRELFDLMFKVGSGFTKWIQKHIKSENIDELLFLSRDAFWLKQIWDLQCRDANDNAHVNSYYLYTSRLAQNQKEDIESKELRNHLDYLGTCIAPGKIYGVIDVGWRGSSVEFLQENFPKSKFVGLFLGSHGNPSAPIISYFGKIRILKFFGFTEFVETIFSAPHASVATCSGSFNAPIIEYIESSSPTELLLVHQELLERFYSAFYNGEVPQLKGKYFLHRVKDSLAIRGSFLRPSIEMLRLFSKIEHSAQEGEVKMSPLVRANWRISEDRCYMLTWNVKWVFFLDDVSFFNKLRQLSVLIALTSKLIGKKIRR